MRKTNYSFVPPWSRIPQGDWPFVVGTAAAAVLVALALIVAPEWRDFILGGVAAIFLVLLGLERARARRRMVRLATQIKSVESLDKLEVPDDPSASALDRALNDAIQRMREQARSVELTRAALPGIDSLSPQGTPDETPRSVTVLAVGLGDQEHMIVVPETTERLRKIARTVVAVAERRSALLQLQGSGTFALIFAAFSHEPTARSAKAAFEAAVELGGAHPALHFGLSSGAALPCALPGTGYTVIGSPLEEAIRLQRLAATWNEYRLLCSEPVALLLRPHTVGQRTPLQLTSSNAPPLPVYSLEIVPDAITLGA